MYHVLPKNLLSVLPDQPRVLQTADRASITNVTITISSPSAHHPYPHPQPQRAVYRGKLVTLPARPGYPNRFPDQSTSFNHWRASDQTQILPFSPVLALYLLFIFSSTALLPKVYQLSSILHFFYQQVNTSTYLCQSPTNEKPPMVRHGCHHIFHAPIPYA